MKIEIAPKVYKFPMSTKEGGTLFVDGRPVAKCGVARTPQGNYWMETWTELPGLPKTQHGNALEAIAAWLARHPEALAPKGKPRDLRDPLTLGRILRNRWKYSKDRPAIMAEAKASRGRLSLPDPEWV